MNHPPACSARRRSIGLRSGEARLGPGTAHPAGAQRLIEPITGPEHAALRQRCGIEAAAEV